MSTKASAHNELDDLSEWLRSLVTLCTASNAGLIALITQSELEPIVLAPFATASLAFTLCLSLALVTRRIIVIEKTVTAFHSEAEDYTEELEDIGKTIDRYNFAQLAYNRTSEKARKTKEKASGNLERTKGLRDKYESICLVLFGVGVGSSLSATLAHVVIGWLR